MKNKLFFFDSINNVKYNYEDLIFELNRLEYIPKYLFTNDYFQIFKYLIGSIIYDIKITVLDYDFSKEEIISLGIRIEDLNSQHHIKNKKHIFLDSILDLMKNSKNWEIALFTSGTTGRPKKVSHTFSNIARMVKVSDEKKNDIWGLAFNPTHIAGIQVFFQAFMNKNSIINLFGLNRNAIFDLIKKFNITNISATPTFFRLLLPFENKYSSIKRISCGGEKFDKKLGDELLKIFPNAKLLNIFASTEAGTIFSSRNDVFEIKDEFKYYIKVENNELFIHKNLLGNSDSLEIVDNNWYKTGDYVEILQSSPLRFRIVGRNNEMINVGGYKVNPTEVENIINSHPSVISSRVYNRKNSVLGNLLVADVKTVKGINVNEKELRLFLEEKLQSYKVPRIINFIDDIELTRSGKIKRT